MIKEREYHPLLIKELSFSDLTNHKVFNDGKTVDARYITGVVRIPQVSTQELVHDTYRYVIIHGCRSSLRGGHYCAYVEVLDTHPIHYMRWNEISDWIPEYLPVNGGLTFADDLDVEDGDNPITYCIGWDYGHACNHNKNITEMEIMEDICRAIEWLEMVAKRKRFTCPTCKQHTDKIHT